MDDDQQFCLRWNNHQSTLISVFDKLLEKGIHVDCTLAAEGQTLKAHKVVLSACSPYFESVLGQQFDKHPIIILKDVKYAELRAMMDYMYRGEVNISQDQLAALLKAAESLQIKGLSDNKPPPRTSSPSLKGRVSETASTGHLHSREGSTSPAPRKRKKPRRASADSINVNSTEHIPSQNHTPVQPPAPIKNNVEHVDNDVVVPIKVNKVSNDIANDVMKNNYKNEDVAEDAKLEFEDGNEDSVEDLTLDEEADSEVDSANRISAGPSIGQGDVVQSFQWHMERSQDEVINAQDGQRDSQDESVQTLHTKLKSLIGVPVIDLDLETSLLDDELDAAKDAQISSALLSLLTARHLQAQGVLPPVVDLVAPPSKDIAAHPGTPEPRAPPDPATESLAEKARAIQRAILQNNNTVSPNALDDKTEFFKTDEGDSEVEYDDTDDIVLPDESQVFYGSSESLSTFGSDNGAPSPTDEEAYARAKGKAGGEDVTRQFECRHCGKRYRWKSTLRRHENVECGGKAPAHQCPYCTYRAKQRGNLGVHIRKHHNKEWYVYASNKIRRSKKTSGVL